MSYADSLETGIRYNINEQHQSFLTTHSGHPKIFQNTFSRWLKLYSEYKDWEINHYHSDAIKFMEFIEKPTRRDRKEATTTGNEPVIEQEVVAPETNI